jgi:hypothetical protein
MSSLEKGPAKFYEIFKVHKAYTPPELPAGRPIVSGCGSISENISLFVDTHAKELVPKMTSFLQHTPDLLRQLEKLNGTTLPAGSFPVSMDEVGLYQNIPHNKGIEAMRTELDKRKDKTVPTNLLVELLTHVLEQNIFKFNS